jgi:hypothetical protein
MKPLIVLLSTAIAGCSNLPMIDVSHEWHGNNPHVYESTSKIFVGIPMLLSMEGSSVRLNDEWVLTNKHNWPILAIKGYISGLDVFYHPDCDIAMYRDPVKSASVGLVYLNQTVIHSGYPVNEGYATSQGLYVGDVVSSDYPNCQMSMSTGGVKGGMSGGGVWNEQGELVGITVGYLPQEVEFDGETFESPSVWVSLNLVKHWIGYVSEQN